MTAWRQGLETAPKDKAILVRFSENECPVVLKYEVEFDFWGWCDDLLQDACDPINTVEATEFQWAPIPE